MDVLFVCFFFLPFAIFWTYWQFHRGRHLLLWVHVCLVHILCASLFALLYQRTPTPRGTQLWKWGGWSDSNYGVFWWDIFLQKEVIQWEDQNEGSTVRITQNCGHFLRQITNLDTFLTKTGSLRDSWKLVANYSKRGSLGKIKIKKGSMGESKLKNGLMWPRIPITNFKWVHPMALHNISQTCWFSIHFLSSFVVNDPSLSSSILSMYVLQKSK